MSHPEDQRRFESEAQSADAQDAAALSLEARLDQAQAQSEDFRRQAESNLGIAQRAQADFLNYKRRTAAELEQKIRDANAGLLTKILPVIDDFQLALANLPADLDGHPWPQGIAMISQKFENLLQQQGLERIGSEGDLFDPRVHEAVAYEEHPVYDEGQVASVYRIGYRLNDRVLRPAQVVVARGSSRRPSSAEGESRPVGDGAAQP
jgi:molecular chaperone GrpE